MRETRARTNELAKGNCELESLRDRFYLVVRMLTQILLKDSLIYLLLRRDSCEKKDLEAT